MNEPWQGRRTRLWLLMLIALAYMALLRCLSTLTDSTILDGIIGMLLGLYVAAQPAANMLTLLFHDRTARRQTLSAPAGILWVALNILVLLIGSTIVTIGATQLARQAFERSLE